MTELSIDDFGDFEVNVEPLSDPETIKSLTSLHINTNLVGWTDYPTSLLIDLISTSASLKELEITNVRFRSDNLDLNMDLFRKCMVAAKHNPHVRRINLQKVAFNNQVAGRVSEAIVIGGSKIESAHLQQKDGEIERIEMGLLNSAIASLPTINKLRLDGFGDGVFVDLMGQLSIRESPSLKEFEITWYDPDDEEPDLPGIDTFLASKGAASILKLEVFGGKISDEAFRRLRSGLERNLSIKNLRLTTEESSRGATNILSNYLRGVTTLKEFDINFYPYEQNQPMRPYFEENILLALGENTSIRKLTSVDTFFDPSTGTKLSHLLKRNPHLESVNVSFENNGDVILPSVWLQNLSEGLSLNSTLKSLDIWIAARLDVGFLLAGLRNGASRLVSLSIAFDSLIEGSTNQIVSALNDSTCRLQNLQLSGNIRDDEFLNLLSGIEPSTNLRSATIRIMNPIRTDTLHSTGRWLEKMPLRKLEVIVNAIGGVGDEDTLDDSAARSINEDLLRGMSRNYSLESLSISLHVRPSFDDLSFDQEIDGHCTRNMSARAAKDIMNHDLPFAVLPSILDALSDRCDSEEQYNCFSSTVLFATLRTMLQDNATCDRLKGLVLGEESGHENKRRRIV